MSAKDSLGNVSRGENILIESNNNFIRTSTKPVVLVGVDDMIVLETEKAILMLPREKAQDVKKAVDWLKENGRGDLL
jgi:Mannose-6-phosphate isomerase